MTVPDMVQLFSATGLQRKAAIFDPQKLEWMNGQHLSLISLDDLLPRVVPALVSAGLATTESLGARPEWFRALIDLLRVRARTVLDIVRQAEPYLRDVIGYDPETVAKQWKDRAGSASLLARTRERLSSVTDWTPQALEPALRDLAEAQGLTAGKIFQPLRVALTGLSVSPGIFDVLVMLGRDRSLARIDAAVGFLQ